MQDILKLSVQQRVQKGVELLDKVEPDWFKKVNPLLLDIRGETLCILGQLYGTYTNGLNYLRKFLNNNNYLAGEHGLYFTDYDYKNSTELNDCWKQVIKEKFNAVL